MSVIDDPTEPIPPADGGVEQESARAVRDDAERRRLQTPSLVEGPAAVGATVFGGVSGRFARVGRRGWPFVAALLSAAASVMVALSVLQKGHCVKVGWGSPGALWRTCYSDIPLGAGTSYANPWSTGAPGQSQPVLTAVLNWILQRIVPGGSSVSQQQILFTLGAAVVVLCVTLTVTATAGTLRDTPWLAAHVALSPVLITASMVSFDTFGIALAALGLWCWARSRPLAAGILLGAAVMARTYPLILIAALVLLCLRDRRRIDLTRLLAGVAGVCAICIGLAVATGGQPFAPYAVWNDATASYGSLWLILSFAGITVPAHTLTGLAIVGWLVAVASGAVLVWTRPRVPFAPLALTMLVIVLLTGKSVSIQTCLWVLPLIALSAMRWREHLAWAGVEIVYFVMTWMYIAQPSNPDKGLPAAGYSVFSIVRLLAYVGLAWAAWESSRAVQRVLGDPLFPPPGVTNTPYVQPPLGEFVTPGEANRGAGGDSDLSD